MSLEERSTLSMSGNCDFASFPPCIFGVAQRHLSGYIIYQDFTSQMKLFNPNPFSPFTVIHACMFSSIYLVVLLRSSKSKTPSTPNFPLYKPHYPLNHKCNKIQELILSNFFWLEVYSHTAALYNTTYVISPASADLIT